MGRRSSVTIRLKNGSGSITLNYLSEEKDRYGNVRLYFRKGGKRVRLRSEVGTQAFLDEHRALLAGVVPQQGVAGVITQSTDSFAWLLQRYYRSPEFKTELGPRTQYVRRGLLDAISLKHGEKPFAKIEPRHVRMIRDEKADAPGTANGRVKALRQLFEWAKGAGRLEKNPAKDVPYIKTGGEGFHAWSPEEVRQFEEHFAVGSMARLAFDLLLYTGVRRSDAVRLGPAMETGKGTIRFVVTKGQRAARRELELPLLPTLRRSIDATPAGKETYIVSSRGQPFTVESFGNWFRKRCNEAGLPHCAAHGLRKAGATLAAERGATAHQLKAIFGWASIKDAEHYTKRANQVTLARDAMRLLEREEEPPDI